MTTLSSSLFEFSSVSNEASSFSETLVNNVYNNYPYKIFVLNSFVLLDSVSLSSVLLPDKSEGVSENNLLLRNLLTNVSSWFNTIEDTASVFICRFDGKMCADTNNKNS